MDQQLFGVRQAAELLGIGRTLLYEEIARGNISTVRIGKRVLISADEIARYVDALVAS